MFDAIEESGVRPESNHTSLLGTTTRYNAPPPTALICRRRHDGTSIVARGEQSVEETEEPTSTQRSSRFARPPSTFHRPLFLSPELSPMRFVLPFKAATPRPHLKSPAIELRRPVSTFFVIALFWLGRNADETPVVRRTSPTSQAGRLP